MATILVLDDDPKLTHLISMMLEASGHRTVLFTDGLEAMQHLTSGQIPDLILLDLAMPGADGQTFLSFLEQSPRTKTTPVILISAMRHLKSQFANDPRIFEFMEKPFEIAELRSAIDAALSSKGGRKSGG